MIEPEQELRKLSFDSDLQQVLRTPNRIKYKNQKFQGWQDLKEHPLQSPQPKINFNSSKTKFKVKTSKININPQYISKNTQNLIQNKQNNQNEKLLKMIKIIDQQTLSFSQRKLLTPKKNFKLSQENNKNLNPLNSKYRFYQTPKSTRRTRQDSFGKMSLAQGINRISMTQKRQKNLNEETDIYESRIDQGQKKQLSAIVYPVLKTGNKKTLRRIQRFHSFVARTVLK